MAITRRVLWVDDDRRERFQYELSVLADYGLTADWAVDAAEAVAKLSKTAYELVLLDQVFPISESSSYKDVWAGCRLLYWLRGLEPPSGAPQGPVWAKFLYKKRPRPKNQGIPVIIISGFQDDHVDKALKKVNHGISIFPKPVDEDNLLITIKHFFPPEMP